MTNLSDDALEALAALLIAAADAEAAELDGNGGTGCEHPGCTCKATDTRQVLGCLRHLCDEHSRRYAAEGDEDAI